MHLSPSKKRIYNLAFVLMAGALTLVADESSPDYGLCLKTSWFKWREFDDNDKQLLEEQGPLFSLELQRGLPNEQRYGWAYRAELFLGKVDYDGATQQGIPTQSRTLYMRLKGEADYGFRLGGQGRWQPYAGFGVRSWLRRLQDSREATGYSEYWSTLYAQTGVRWQLPTRPGIHLGFSVNHALYNYVHYDFSTIDDLDNTQLEPGTDWSWQAESGVGWERCFLVLRWEQHAFGKSDAKNVRDQLVWQWAAEERQLSLVLGIPL